MKYKHGSVSWKTQQWKSLQWNIIEKKNQGIMIRCHLPPGAVVNCCLHLPKPQEQAQSAVSAHLDSTSGCEPPPLPSRAPGVREPPPPLSPSRPGINCHMCIPYQAHPDQHMLSKEAIGISTKNNPGTKYIKLGQATR